MLGWYPFPFLHVRLDGIAKGGQSFLQADIGKIQRCSWYGRNKSLACATGICSRSPLVSSRARLPPSFRNEFRACLQTPERKRRWSCAAQRHHRLKSRQVDSIIHHRSDVVVVSLSNYFVSRGPAKLNYCFNICRDTHAARIAP